MFGIILKNLIDTYGLTPTTDPETGAPAYDMPNGKLVWRVEEGWRSFGSDVLPAPAPWTAQTFRTLEEAVEYATGYGED